MACHPRATCHIAGCNNSIRHIENRFSPYIFLFFKMQFRLWRAAAFVSSPIHLYRYRQVLGVCQDFSARWRTRGAVPGTRFTPDFCISVGYLKKLWTDFDEILCVDRRLLKNACIDLHEMLRVDRCRDMDELINFWARSGLSSGLLSPISFQLCYAEFYAGKIRRIRRPIGHCSEECF